MDEKQIKIIQILLRICYVIIIFLVIAALPMYYITNAMEYTNPSGSSLAELKPVMSLINLERYGGDPWVYVNPIYVIIFFIIMISGMIIAIANIKDVISDKLKKFSWLISAILMLISVIAYAFTPFYADPTTSTRVVISNINTAVVIGWGSILVLIMIGLVIAEGLLIERKR